MNVCTDISRIDVLTAVYSELVRERERSEAVGHAYAESMRRHSNNGREKDERTEGLDRDRGAGCREGLRVRRKEVRVR